MKKIALITIGLLLVTTSLFSQKKSFKDLRRTDKSAEIIDLDVPSKELHLKVDNNVLYASIYDDTILGIVVDRIRKYSTRKGSVISYRGVVSGNDYTKVEYTIFYSKDDSSKVTHTVYSDPDNDFSTYYTVVH